MGIWVVVFVFFFFQAEDGIRDFCLSRGLGDVYKRQVHRYVIGSSRRFVGDECLAVGN